MQDGPDFAGATDMGVVLIVRATAYLRWLPQLQAVASGCWLSALRRPLVQNQPVRGDLARGVDQCPDRYRFAHVGIGSEPVSLDEIIGIGRRRQDHDRQ